jgi:hypothetical protein
MSFEELCRGLSLEVVVEKLCENQRMQQALLYWIWWSACQKNFDTNWQICLKFFSISVGLWSLVEMA